MVEAPFPAYDGSGPFVFVCYAHADAGTVYPEITRIRDSGVNVWYDDGIAAGSEWSAAVADAIERCKTFLYLVSPASVESEHCRRELNFALEQSCSVLAVHLEPTDLPSALKLSLSNRQAILKYKEPRYAEKLTVALLGSAATVESSSSGTRRGRKKTLLAGVLATVLALLGVAFFPFDAEESGPTTVAILDFRDISPSQEYTWLGEGLAQSLRQQIGGLHDYRVLPRSAIPTDGVPESDLLIEGTVQGTGSDLVVQITASKTANNDVVWNTEFPASGADLLEVQKRLAADIARIFGTAASRDSWGPSTPEAYNAFLKYLHHNEGGRPEPTLFWLEEALKFDPDWTFGWGELAWQTTRYAVWEADATYLERARAYLEEARTRLGNPAAWKHIEGRIVQLEGDLDAAERLYRESEDYRSYAQLMANSGLLKEAASYFSGELVTNPHRSGRSGVADPLAQIYAAMGELELSLQAGNACAALAPPRAYNCFHSHAYALPFVDLDAAKALRAEVADTQRTTQAGTASYQNNTEIEMKLDYGIAVAEGRTDEAIAYARTLPKEAFLTAFILLAHGHDDYAQWYPTERRLQFLRTEWIYVLPWIEDRLRDHPEIVKLQSYMGFTKEWRLELCKRAQNMPPESRIGCDPANYEIAGS